MTTLIGRRCTHGNVFSRPVLIGRGLGNELARARYGSLGGTPSIENRFPVAIAAESHPFPFRTRKLSPPAPMVLGGRPPGRVGRRRISPVDEAPRRGGFVALGLRPLGLMARGPRYARTP